MTTKLYWTIFLLFVACLLVIIQHNEVNAWKGLAESYKDLWVECDENLNPDFVNCCYPIVRNDSRCECIRLTSEGLNG